MATVSDKQDPMESNKNHPRTTRRRTRYIVALVLLASATIGSAQAPTYAALDTFAPGPTMVPGIYAVDGTSEPTELLATLSSRTRLKGIFGMAFSFGLARARALAYLQGDRAPVRASREATFRFRFDPTASAFGRDAHLPSSVPTAASPAEFMLVRMEATRGDRRFQYARYSLATSETGATAEANVPFTIQRTGTSEFEVLASDLPPGEYAWVWLGDLNHGGGPVRVHAFGIDP